MSATFDVAVIGGGMAGAVAARDLSAKGFSVVLLEARNRLGGRTYVDHAFDGDIELEMGGAYVHWTQPHMWHELERHGLSVKPPLQSNRYIWLADFKVHSGTEEDYLAAVGPILGRFFADARARFPLPSEPELLDNSDLEKQSVADRIQDLSLSRYERDVLDGALSGVVHSYQEQGLAQLIHATAIYFGDFNAIFETAGFWSIQGGTKSLLDAIQAESTAEVRLSTPVSAIQDHGSHVTVTTKSGTQIQARSAVVAVPLNTVGDMTIRPELPSAVRTMIRQKNPVKAHKIWVRVKGEIEPFNGFAPVGQGPINAFRTERRYKGDTLIMGICSDAAAIKPDDRAAVQRALRVFVPDIEVVDTACHDWVADEYAQGGWMMHRPGNLTGAAPQMRLPHGRIQFAGADIAALEAGSIEGAMASGVLAARNVEAILGHA